MTADKVGHAPPCIHYPKSYV